MNKTNSLIRRTLKTFNYQKYAVPVVFILLFAIIGALLLHGSKAAGPYASVEASSGTLTNGATSITDSSASNNSYVQFGTESTGGSSNGGCTSGSNPAPCMNGSNNGTGASGWGSPVFDDEFNGSSLDTSKWFNESGYCKNGMTVSTSNETESGGDLILTFTSGSGLTCNGNSSSGYGAEISTSSYTLPVGGYAEASVYFPGNGTSIYNWPAWWTAGNGWPASGEHDIFEGLGSATANYHFGGLTTNGTTDCTQAGTTNCQKGPFDISGTWSNAFHTFGLYRGSGYADVYWDGTLVKSYSTLDNGGGENLILTNGCSGSCTSGAQVKVDYARAWNTGPAPN